MFCFGVWINKAFLPGMAAFLHYKAPLGLGARVVQPHTFQSEKNYLLLGKNPVDFSEWKLSHQIWKNVFTLCRVLSMPKQTGGTWKKSTEREFFLL